MCIVDLSSRINKRACTIIKQVRVSPNDSQKLTRIAFLCNNVQKSVGTSAGAPNASSVTWCLSDCILEVV